MAFVQRYFSSIAVSVLLFFVLSGVLFFLLNRAQTLLATGRIEAYLLPGTSLETTVYIVLLMLGIFASFFLSLVVFLITASQMRAGRVAEQLTDELVSSRELFIQLYDASPVPYILLTQSGAIAFPNTAALRLFGGKQEQIVDISLFERISIEGSEEEKRHVELLPTLFQQGSAISNEEVQIERLDGTHRWVLLSVFPLSSAGSEHSALVTLVDITKQKEIERAKSEFVSLASHQLRTPLSSLKWHIELLTSPKMGALTDKQRDHIVAVTRGVERLGTIVDDFLNVSRLELGTLKAKQAPVKIPDLVNMVLTDLEPRTTEKQLEVHKNIAVDTVTTDRRLLRMALENLLTNAIKYTPARGSISVEVRSSGDNVTISVTDSGMGIPKEEQEKIFTKLFRASNVRDEVPEGTGLGLYIAKMVLGVLGGDITFESTPRQGTTFTISLPYV